jgi:hypothetical protein
MFLVCVGAISVPLVAAALAYGCTSVATLTTSPGAATAGSTVSVTGKFFGTHDGPADATNGLAEVRLGSLTGPVLATGSPTGSDKSFTVNVTIPAGTPAGDTFIAATQKTAAGTPVYGTPARQAFKVLASSAPSGGGDATAPATTNKVVATQPGIVAETLTLSEARRAAKMKIKRSNRSARSLRASCSRRSRTSASCMVRWSSKGKSHSKRVVIKSEASAAAW